MDNRISLPSGYELRSTSRAYLIEHYISAGSNSIVYQAVYEDTLMPEHVHTVLIKELYPLDDQNRITRDESMSLCISPEVRDMFEYQKASFLLGNQAHLTLSAEGSERIAENLDSFEANGTVYTVLTAKKGEVLSAMLERGETFPTVTDAALCIKNLLYALKSFHSHKLLHLDISPDNIFLLTPSTGGQFPVDVLLLDFNSVYSMDKGPEKECQYYLGKQDYMAPEVALHNEKELGPWTDLYSVSVVFYEILTGKPLQKDRELLRKEELLSPYAGLLLHEKEQTAWKVNEILAKGLKIQPQDRYQEIGEMLKDIQDLLDILNGVLRIPMVLKQEESLNKPISLRKRAVRAGAVLAMLALAAGAGYVAQTVGEKQPQETAGVDFSKYPLETDDSVVLTQRNVRHPLEDNVLTMQVNAKTDVEVNLKDFDHPVNPEDVFEGFALFCFYNGKGDRRGWRFGDTTYDFFYTEDNKLRMVLPIQDENDFDLEYVGLAFQNSNYDDTAALLDVTKFTLTDGEGKSYEMTELLGSHVLFFDEENWQMNLMTTQSQDYVKSFREALGGELVVDASACFLDPVLELTFTSEDPDVISVDNRGRITANRIGVGTITITVKDKGTGDERSTQMLVNVTSRLQ